MSRLSLASLALAGLVTTALANAQVASGGNNPVNAAEPAHEVVLTSEVEWEQLNPARGDKSPQAGTLWGDRNGSEPTGFLVKVVDPGSYFSSMGASVHQISSEAGEPCIIYVRTEGTFDVVVSEPEK